MRIRREIKITIYKLYSIYPDKWVPKVRVVKELIEQGFKETTIRKTIQRMYNSHLKRKPALVKYFNLHSSFHPLMHNPKRKITLLQLTSSSEKTVEYFKKKYPRSF